MFVNDRECVMRFDVPVGSQWSLVEKERKVEEPLVKQHHWHDMWAIGKQGKDCNSCLGNSRKAYHATKAVIQRV